MTPRLLLAAAMLLSATPAWASGVRARGAPARASSVPADPNSCPAAIQVAEGASHLPPGLLGSIAMVESGRIDPRTGRPAPWPWTINVAGAGFFFQTKEEAIAAVEAARATGVRSIDVGCMQVNLMHHPDAFATLDQAFDPGANAAYAAGFLTRLFHQAGSWPEAAASYHSATPGLREDYQRRVLLGWAGGASYGGVLAMVTAKPAIDPQGHYTPAFRAQLAENASDHAAWVRMGLVPLASPAGRSPAGRSVAGGSPAGTSNVSHVAATAPRSHIRLASLARLGSGGN